MSGNWGRTLGDMLISVRRRGKEGGRIEKIDILCLCFRPERIEHVEENKGRKGHGRVATRHLAVQALCAEHVEGACNEEADGGVNTRRNKESNRCGGKARVALLLRPAYRSR